jgi:hypothetical protein
MGRGCHERKGPPVEELVGPQASTPLKMRDASAARPEAGVSLVVTHQRLSQSKANCELRNDCEELSDLTGAVQNELACC